MKRYFEFVDNNSAKFWEVWPEAATLFIRFGKIGTNGQTTTKEFSDAAAVTEALNKAVAEKIRKGYIEIESN